MGEVKWVKMSIDMFDNRKIKYLRGLPEGNNIVLIWVMLLTLAGRCNSNGYIFLTENIPYTPAMLANELGFPESTILVAMKALESMGMISRNEENTLMIPGWEEHQNVAALEQIRENNRKRQARYREQAKIEAVEQETPPPVEEKKEEQEEPKPSKKAEETKEAKILFERLWSLYPNKKGKGQVSDTAKKNCLKSGRKSLREQFRGIRRNWKRRTGESRSTAVPFSILVTWIISTRIMSREKESRRSSRKKTNSIISTSGTMISRRWSRL